MPSDLENLQASYSAAIAAYREALANPKPDYAINGQSVNWAAYLEMLKKQIQELKPMIQAEEGPFAILQQGV